MKTIPVTYIAFDLLYLDGRSVIKEPLEDRKQMLDELVVKNPRIDISTCVEGDGKALFDAASAAHLEGIVAKKLGSPYRPGKRGRDWLKVKTTYEADVVIGGWTRGEGSRSERFGSLLVGAYEGGNLRFTGAVGTGFNDRTLDDLLGKMRALETDTNPFDSDPQNDKVRWGKPIKNPHWTRPQLVAVVEFRELTSAGKLRAPSFKGLREDKGPQDCLFEDLGPKDLDSV
jgi:bifunctional non-homologous end joining protein LigD